MVRIKRIWGVVIIYLILFLFFIISFFPVFYTFMSSFKSNMDILTTGNMLIPKQFVLDNYVKDSELRDFRGRSCRQYVEKNLGATDKIVSVLEKH